MSLTNTKGHLFPGNSAGLISAVPDPGLIEFLGLKRL